MRQNLTRQNLTRQNLTRPDPNETEPNETRPWRDPTLTRPTLTRQNLTRPGHNTRSYWCKLYGLHQHRHHMSAFNILKPQGSALIGYHRLKLATPIFSHTTELLRSRFQEEASCDWFNLSTVKQCGSKDSSCLHVCLDYKPILGSVPSHWVSQCADIKVSLLKALT